MAVSSPLPYIFFSHPFFFLDLPRIATSTSWAERVEPVTTYEKQTSGRGRFKPSSENEARYSVPFRRMRNACTETKTGTQCKLAPAHHEHTKARTSTAAASGVASALGSSSVRRWIAFSAASASAPRAAASAETLMLWELVFGFGG